MSTDPPPCRKTFGDDPVTPHPAFRWPDDRTWRRDAERSATKREALARERLRRGGAVFGLVQILDWLRAQPLR